MTGSHRRFGYDINLPKHFGGSLDGVPIATHHLTLRLDNAPPNMQSPRITEETEDQYVDLARAQYRAYEDAAAQADFDRRRYRAPYHFEWLVGGWDEVFRHLSRQVPHITHRNSVRDAILSLARLFGHDATSCSLAD